MISANELGPELLDMGRIIGLIREDGTLNSSWFDSPLTRLESVFSDATQRAALLRLLDALLPPAQLPGVPDNEKWHPLLGDQPSGNVYLTVRDASGGVQLGVGGDFGDAGGPGLSANLRVQLPLVSTTPSLQSVAGTTQGPLKIEVTIHLGWVRNAVPTPAQPIGLEAIILTGSIAPPDASLVVTLKKLALDDRPPQDTVLDPDQLGAEAMQLILGLLKQNLRQVTAAAGAEAVAVRDHLLPLFGLDGDGIPPFPFAQLFNGPAALQGWLRQLLEGAAPPITAWLGHLGGLVGAASTIVSGAGTEVDPWHVQAIPFDAQSGLAVTLANGSGSLKIGLAASLVPPGATPVARVEAQATLAAIPLNGTASATVLPAASITFRAPGSPGAPDLVSDAHITIDSLRGGLSWNGSALAPLLELDDVTLEGTHYARLDLTNTDSVVAAASAAVQAAIRNALGTGAGSHLAALAGLIAPSGDPTSTHLIDPSTLVSNPARAIAAVHRAVLLDGVHNWSFMLAEIAGLLGFGGGVAGSGTQSDPWHVQVGPASAINVELVAWNAQPSGNAADPQQLRLGLRASASSTPLEFSWLAELLAFDLPQSGEGAVGLMAGQHASLRIQPGPAIPPAAGIHLSADSFTAEMNFSPGSAIAWQAAVNNLSLTVDATTINIPALRFPAATGFDVNSPAATAASLGISIPNLELLLRSLVAHAALSFGGMPGFTLAGLLGVHKGLSGYPTDWPTLADPGAAGSLLNDPLNALRRWLDEVATNLSADGSPFLPSALGWLQALLSNSLPAGPSLASPGATIQGAGTYDDPWALPVTTGAQSVDALLWLEPAGPPSNWAGALADHAGGTLDFGSLLEVLQSLAAFSAPVRDAVTSLDVGTISRAIERLDDHLTNSDGVVPIASQIPTGETWTSGTLLNSAHHLQPRDPAAITQILAQIDTLAGGVAGDRAVLLIGPAFTDHTNWQDLLAHPDRHGTTDPAAHFNLRVPGLNPNAVDLSTVTATVDYYTADLQTEGSGDATGLVNQINRIVARLGALRPGVPVTLVAHSTAGVAARIFTADNPLLVRGLITLGTPHKGATLPFLTDPAMADAVRLVQGLRNGMTASSPLREALDHIFQALDGFIPPTAPGALPTQAAYPVASFAGTTSDDTGGQPAFALGGTLAENLFDALQQAVASLATQAAAVARPVPTHLGFGVRARLGLPDAAPGDLRADAALRADVFRARLRDGVAEPTRPAHSLGVEVKLERPGGWLVGGASAFGGVGLPPVDVRVRQAEFGVVIQTASGGGAQVQVTPRLTLRQASYHGPMLSRVGLDEQAAQAQALLGAVLQAITFPAPAATTPVSGLVNALEALGVAVPDSHGGFGISADAFAAILTDAASFFAPRLPAALDGVTGLAGLRGPAGGPWTFAPASLPLEIYLAQTPWRLGLRTTPAPAGALALGTDASLSFDASVTLPGSATTLDATLRIGGLNLSYTQSTRQLVLQLPCLPSLTLLPAPNAAEFSAALNHLLPRVLFSSSAGAVVQALTGPNFRLGALDCFLSETGAFLQRSSSLGNSSGEGLDATKLTSLLQAINRLAGLPDNPGLQLPAGFQLTATGTGTEADPVRLNLATIAPIGGVLGVALAATIDRQLHVQPGGTLSLTTPLNGDWPAVTLTFGVDAGGVSLVVAPQGVTPIQVLPTFSGLGSLRGAAEALLPAALDRMVASLSTPGPQPVWLTRLLAVVEALGLYDNAGHFSAHSADLRALLQADWLSLFDPSRRAAVAAAVANLINSIGALPATATPSGSLVNWSFTLGGADAGTVGIAVGWDGSGPVANLTATAVKLGGGAITANLSAGYAGGTIHCSTDLSASLQSALHLDIKPKLAVGFGSSGGHNQFNVNLLPLAATGADGPFRIELAPTPGVHGAAGAELIEHWLLPLTADLIFEAVKAKLADPVWTGGQLLRDVLAHTHLIVKGATPADDHLNSPLPDVQAMVTGLVTGLAGGGGVSVNVTPTLTLRLTENGGRFGVRLSGHEDFNVGQFGLSIRFGAPHEWTPSSGTAAALGADFGVALFLFQTAAGGSFTFNPGLFVAGLGLGLSGTDDGPLIDTSGFRMGAARLYTFFTAELRGGLTVRSLGGGLELDALGLPLGLATSGNVGGNNPVASNLLQSGAGSTGGDQQPVNPGVDISTWYWSGPAGDDQFHILFGGESGTLWIGIHRGFGPIYIDQVGLEVGNTNVGLLIDGSVKVDGLTAQVDDLTISVPYRSILDPSQWSLDLRGLAIGFKSPGVTIAGGLIKVDGPPVEYDGLLLIQITQFGFVAVGAYSTPTDAATGEQYTSLFVFAGVFIVIGIPPIIEIDGLGLGVGYNRQLIVPEDLNQVPDFVLVSALDDGGAIANDPMGTLRRIREQMPARRGSFWLAVGLRGSSFVIVHVTAVVYIALDRGVEIGLVGVARMELPSSDSAMVSVELALKARFSTAEGILSVQAQLTDNSWLLSRDCQLTGGFAYFAWFKKSQFLLTLGGYHPAFHKPPEFPEVPRIGYHWSFLGVVNIKGETYFALTNSCVMAGTRMEATYGPSWLQVWFTAYTDFLVSWDPFFYDIRIGVEVGARFRIRICFFGCVTIHISVSLGATLKIQGPPLHGTVTVDLEVASVTVAFGPDPDPQPSYLSWTGFKDKYLRAGDPTDTAVTVHVLEGLLPPEPPGGQPAPGTEAQPWKMASEFEFQTETRMPATKHSDFVAGAVGPDTSRHHALIDIAPMGKESIGSEHLVTLEASQTGPLDPGEIGVWHLMTTPEAERFRIHPERFNTERLIGQVSEATYHFIDHDHIPAAANTLPVITGVRIKGFAVLTGESAVIPWAKLVDSGFSRPLPFATLTVTIVTGLQAFGQAADVLGLITATASSGATIAASRQLLGGGGFFSEARSSAGLPATGLTPLASRALESYRSSPPLITPITTGLTMKPVGQDLPPVTKVIETVLPVALTSPRLRAVLQSQPLPTVDAPPAIRTTVTRQGTEKIPRLAAPKLTSVAGAHLEFVSAPDAPRPTTLACSGRTLRNAELGWSAGGAHIEAFSQAESHVLDDGVTLPAGTTHIWELPNARGRAILVNGEAAVRITCLTRGGRIIADQEQTAHQGTVIRLSDVCGMVAVTCLGRIAGVRAEVSGGLGAVSFNAAPPGRSAVVGWQSDNLLPQVGSAALLGRGACLILPQPHVPLKGRQRTTQAMLRVSEALAQQQGVETWLPVAIGVVGVILDQQDTCAASEGDFSIAATGARLTTPPLRIEGGRRKMLLYNVVEREAETDHIKVSVASREGSRFAGVVGLAGRAEEWAARMNGGVPEHFVPDGPLTPDGQVVVRIAIDNTQEPQ